MTEGQGLYGRETEKRMGVKVRGGKTGVAGESVRFEFGSGVNRKNVSPELALGK